MSPIFVRPVREQLEHDRLIRFLESKYKRKADTALNVGDEQNAPVKLGGSTFFPDLLLTAGRKVAAVVEVETGESVNNLEAMAQWVHFAKARVPFHLYVPVQSYEVARRLLQSFGAKVTELWTYRPTHEGFDLVRMLQDPTAPGPTAIIAPLAEKAAAVKKAAAKPAARKAPAKKPARKAPAKKAAAKKTAKKPAAKSKAKKPTKSAVSPKATRPRKAVRKR